MDIEKFDINDSLKAPGTFVAIYLVGLIIKFMGLSDLASALTSAFSPPFAFIFIIESLLDRPIKFKSHVIGMVLMSFTFFMIANLPAKDFADILFIFCQGLVLALFIMFLYYFLYRNLPTNSRRQLFFMALLPTVLISSILIHLIIH
ncbi:MAG TPA: hypothetical protein ENF49_00240 [Candidatus Altiarchaeales archaeon]|nr:hypothetical protein [Candidatus Altiarchaeales archaeon]HEX54547.1 hypothetical protein [Candidatus Altiarchaeales archaeon]